MGANESSQKKPAATPQDIEKALDKQRKMFEKIHEQKIKELVQEKNTQATTTAMPPTATQAHAVKKPAATPQDIEKALDKQRKMFEKIHEQKIKELVQEKNTQATTTAMPPTATQAHAVNMERQQQSFMYNNTPSLYPNLPTGYSAQGNMVPSMTFHAGPSNSYVPNNNFYNQPQFAQAPAANFPPQPSAPPSISDSSKSTRSRSQSRHRDATSNINCVTCCKMFGEKIFQCNQNHNSCHLCKLRQISCGECRLQITNRRNFALEKTVSEKRVQCPNSADGCRLYIRMGDMNIHEKECPFKVLKCPSLGSICNWRGKLPQLAQHFKEMHPMHNQCDIDKEMFISNVTNTSHTMHYIQIGSFHFLFHVKVSQPDSRIYMIVQLIGTKHSAAKWYYEIHMYKKNEPRRKFQFFEKCSSSVETIEGIINNATCVVIPQEYAKTFLCNGSVAYKCYIKSDDKNEIEESVQSDAQSQMNKGDASRPRRNNFKKYAKKNKVPAN